MNKINKNLLSAKVSGIIFDCDGVLLNSRNSNISYYNMLLKALGREPMSREQEEFVHMASEWQAINHILKPEEVARYEEIAANIPYREIILPLLELEEGARQTLFWLRNKGLHLAIDTNRGSGMWDLLNKFSLQGVFDPVITVDLVAPKPSGEGVRRILDTWNISANKVIFVGDSEADMLAAKEEAVPFIAFGNKELNAASHVKNFKELRDLLNLVII